MCRPCHDPASTVGIIALLNQTTVLRELFLNESGADSRGLQGRRALPTDKDSYNIREVPARPRLLCSQLEPQCRPTRVVAFDGTLLADGCHRVREVGARYRVACVEWFTNKDWRTYKTPSRHPVTLEEVPKRKKTAHAA